MAVSVEELRQLVDAALAAGAAVDDDPGAASRAVATLDQLAQQQVLLTGCSRAASKLKLVAPELVATGIIAVHTCFSCRSPKCLTRGFRT